MGHPRNEVGGDGFGDAEEGHWMTSQGAGMLSSGWQGLIHCTYQASVTEGVRLASSPDCNGSPWLESYSRMPRKQVELAMEIQRGDGERLVLVD